MCFLICGKFIYEIVEYYNKNGKILRKLEFDSDNVVKYTYEYEANGYYTKKYKDEEGNDVIEYYDNYDHRIG